jgi:hypothetical protein
VLVPHVHDCSRLTSVGLRAEKAAEVLLDLSRDPTHRASLAGPVLAEALPLTLSEL